MRRLSRLALAALLVFAAAAPVRAQTPQRGGVRGVVRSTLGDPIPYAVVVLEPGVPRRFTDDSGSFAFPGLAPGTYVLRARQVGFKPVDTTVVVTGDSAVVVSVALEHFVVELAAIRVVAPSYETCAMPGAPDPALYPGFAAVFEQLRQNGERYWLLADSYPAIYRLERRFGHTDNYFRRLVVDRTDTVELRTDARWHYTPGRVVTEVPGPSGTEMQFNLPGLPDFADSAFVANHCFRFGGLEKLEGRRYVRLDFRAADAIKDPDAGGSALLDPESYVVHLLRVYLTRADLVTSGLESFQATVTFREVTPRLVLPDRISSVQRSSVSAPGMRWGTVSTVVETVEDQRTVSVSFVRALPTQRP